MGIKYSVRWYRQNYHRLWGHSIKLMDVFHLRTCISPQFWISWNNYASLFHRMLTLLAYPQVQHSYPHRCCWKGCICIYIYKEKVHHNNDNNDLMKNIVNNSQSVSSVWSSESYNAYMIQHMATYDVCRYFEFMVIIWLITWEHGIIELCQLLIHQNKYYAFMDNC